MTVNELINHYRRGSYTYRRGSYPSSKILENQCVDFGIFLLAESSSFMYAWEPPSLRTFSRSTYAWSISALVEGSDNPYSPLFILLDNVVNLDKENAYAS